MRRPLTIILALLFLVLMLAFTVTYTVRFTERAVLTTFGKAAEGAGAVQTEGLKFKWPYPIQSVTKYDTRLRHLQAKLETQQTADNRQIVVEAFCVWRVQDPLKFFQSFSSAGPAASDHYAAAATKLQSRLRNAVGATSRFRMDELFPADKSASRLGDLEKEILARLNAASDGDAPLSDSGVEVVAVGVNRLVLPEATTKAVFLRMSAAQEKLARELESQGEAEAQAIRSRARADAERIRAFAERRAEEIRARGDVEAAQYIKQMDSNVELAIFLRKLDFLRTAYGARTTLVLPDSIPGIELLSPAALTDLDSGRVPGARTTAEGLERLGAGGANPKPRPAAEGERP